MWKNHKELGGTTDPVITLGLVDQGEELATVTQKDSIVQRIAYDEPTMRPYNKC